MLRRIATLLLLTGFLGTKATAVTCYTDKTPGFSKFKYTIAIDASAIKIKPSACVNNDGAITGIVITSSDAGALSLSWKDQTGREWGTATDLINVPAGNYTLRVTATDGSSQTYGPVMLKNTDAPVINQNSAVITPTPCGQFTGSVTGITATGTGVLKYSWKDQFGTEVSTAANLINKYAGSYQLTVTDDNGCGPAVSSVLVIPELNGVSLNTTNGQALSASCEKANGSITGLQATGATQIAWTKKGDETIIGNAIDLKDIPAGDYMLTLKNTTCSKSYDFTVGALASSTFTDLTVTVTNTCNAFVSGKIEVDANNAVEEPAAYRWVNSVGANAAFGKIAEFLAEGTYKLYLTNKYGCENFYKEYTVGKYPLFVNTAFGTITNIKCGIGRGSITGIAFTGGSGSYVYEWFGPNGTLITGKTDPFLDDLSPGKYTLRTTDGGCSLSENIYTITDEVVPQAPPVIPNVNLLSAGQATINITDPYTTAIYRLYDAATATTPIDEQRGGTFIVNVTQNRSFYISLTYGYCESERVEVKVSIDPTANTITNTFTPNGDGVNDYWKIKGLDGYINATVSIYTRSGKIIFQSKGYAVPFDGTYQGKALPSGIYYYTIRLADGKIIAGNLTILR